MPRTSLQEGRARTELVAICRRLDAKGILTATDGNVSVRLGEAILVTPSGCCKGLLEESDLALVLPDGTVAAGGRPSSELALHRAIYARRPDAAAVVHAHPPYATAFAVAGIALDRPILSEAVLALGDVPVVPYATPTRDDLARSIEPWIGEHDALLLAHHGAVTVGGDLRSAALLMETLEHVARIDWLSRALGPRVLSDDSVATLREIRAALRSRSD